MLSIDSAEPVAARAGSRRMPATSKETAMSTILSAILLISYAGLLAIALILAARVDNDDQE